MQTFFPWVGGKRQLAKRLLSLIPDHTCYVEIFAGSARLLFSKDPDASKAEVINDLDDDIVNLFDVVQAPSKFKGFLDRLRWLLSSRTKFEQFKRFEVIGLTPVDRAVRFYYLLKNCFAGNLKSPTFGYGTSRRAKMVNGPYIQARLAEVHGRLRGVYIEHLDFEDCIRRYDRTHTFFYADPPYIDAKEHRCTFTESDHARLASALRGIKGRFLLSYNDHPTIRRLYKGHRIRTVHVQYTISRRKGLTPSHELLIANYPLPRKIGLAETDRYA